MNGFIGISTALSLYFFRDEAISIFTDQLVLIPLIEEAIPIACLIIFQISLINVAKGAMNGLGLQKIGTIIQIFSFYLVAIPLSAYLGIVQELDLVGLWEGIVIG